MRDGHARARGRALSDFGDSKYRLFGSYAGMGRWKLPRAAVQSSTRSKSRRNCSSAWIRFWTIISSADSGITIEPHSYELSIIGLSISSQFKELAALWFRECQFGRIADITKAPVPPMICSRSVKMRTLSLFFSHLQAAFDDVDKHRVAADFSKQRRIGAGHPDLAAKF